MANAKTFHSQKVSMKQLCDDLTQFAIQVRQIGYSVNGGVGERECLDLSARMLAAVKQAQARELTDLAETPSDREQTG
ncbi:MULTISPECIES: hypothetical protein [unclassified Mycobacterium]|uniref:hypothetical protein n=1 Tax=unclassified Mycobacterium TaxID=2642494 RepID=UPI0007FF6B17|nr:MULTISPECIES: hypothetical protein [unclassified Mycobacterium]OBH12911.1 hypothetical protein A9X04_16630 [Mycobacterium sp. E3247]OBI19756.1 hypothetical protein A5713_15590 [Mycobacterium sp. E2497]